MTDHHGCDAGFGVPSDGVGVVDGLKRARSLSYGFQRARRVRTTMPTRR